ncbi:hypothetical protein [Clostridium saccharobutylicum]|uniref:Uncharacterized protein n=1 Tax=Clostridium saccharobutylicum DSM 13864 TaxID=1345695 RepID=U5MT35_CLOSA|nr:hypothetical protein [Clostridium saccharobutylicum]AGX43909.1 hypothetical protein CLSA_c29420 [Clostridium saccharobutylicum DSM 13864]AQR91206.1 hypothetical protein CLOSC_29300 [Clostridium saccharobutylicum]AQS01110.1 hypothetical protein CSACC_29370 [Clostridium saccharobutylicum]AQS15093.1 hypothetical protein CLOSACC_29370 [Clostridium saccharobutylicum]MBA2905219.1 hypothetical protein [Clostridium saccharobutylicum]
MMKKGNMSLLGNGYKEILGAINRGSIYVGINFEVIILIKKKADNFKYEGMAYSLLTYNVAVFEVNLKELKEMYKDLLYQIIDEQFELEDDQEHLKDNMMTALTELGNWKKSSKVINLY